MGLDVVAYSNLVVVGLKPENCEEYQHRHPYGGGKFEHMLGSLNPRMCYAAGPQTTEWHFRAGSYGGYNTWRAQLCRMALNATPEAVWSQPSLFRDQPFVTLINFSDCEGYIGPEPAARLYAEFLSWENRAEREAPEWFMRVYRSFKTAFQMAAQNGCVVFC